MTPDPSSSSNRGDERSDPTSPTQGAPRGGKQGDPRGDTAPLADADRGRDDENLRDAVRALAAGVERLASRGGEADAEVAKELSRARELLGQERSSQAFGRGTASRSAPPAGSESPSASGAESRSTSSREGGDAPEAARSAGSAPEDDDDNRETREDLQRALL